MPAAPSASGSRLIRWLLLCALMVTATGCQTASYCTQAVRGQFQLWSRQQPIPKLLEAERTPPELKARLEMVLAIRHFAEHQLKLPANGHYLKYADLERRFVVWNVYAAPEFSLTPKSWWYPVVGALDYRGYFEEAKARAYADRLRARGFDVYLGGVTAYSTLGWFHDPVLNTFVFESDADLAELIFHELAHQRLFIAGDTEFNEAFATAVAEEGTRRWMESRHDAGALEAYLRQARRTEEFVALVSRTRKQLEDLFAMESGSATEIADPDSLRLRKLGVFEQMREQYSELRGKWGGSPEYDAWFSRPLNNAQLNTVDTYYKLVPSFRAVLAQQKGDLEKFFATVEGLKRLNKDERRTQLAALASSNLRSNQAAAE